MAALWGAVAASVIGAGASIAASNRASDAIRDSSREATAAQQEGLRTAVALQRPQLEVGNSALSVLAGLFGLEQPSQIDFNAVGGSRQTGPFDPNSGLTNEQQATLANFVNSFGFDPIANPEQAAAVSVNDFASDRHHEHWAAFRAAFGYDPLERDGNPFFDPNVQQQQTQQAAPSSGLNLDELVSNNPLIRFQREEGERAIARGAAARGLNQSGGTLRELTRFNTDLTGAGLQQFVLNPLFQLAGFGPQAAANLQSSTQTTANNVAGLIGQAGDARASAFQNAGNIAGNVGSDLGLALLLNRGNRLDGGTRRVNPSSVGFGS